MKARDRKAIKRYAARELEQQRNELIRKINRQRNEMEASICRSIKQMDMKQLKVAYIDDRDQIKAMFQTIMQAQNENAEMVIHQMPTVDAVPVVRCKDCRHWGCGLAFQTDAVKECEYGHYMVGENGYCVYGEAN